MTDPIKGLDSTTSEMQLNTTLMLEHGASRHRDQEIVTGMGDGRTHSLTYAELEERVETTANLLEDIGIGPGDVVGLAGYSTYRFVELLYAVSGIGATPFMVNVDLPAEHQEFCLDHVEDNAPFDTVFLDQELFNDEGAYELNRSVFDGRDYEAVIYGDDDTAVETDIFDDVLRYSELRADADSDFEFPEIDEDTAALLMFTSGTTGNPKAMTHSHRSIYLHNIGMMATKGLDPQDSLLMVPPVFHLGWNLWGIAPLCGGKLVLPGYGYPENLPDLILDEDVTFSAAVPTLFERIADVVEQRREEDPSVDLEGLEALFGGQSPPIGLLRRLEELGVTTSQVYGFTESCGPTMSFNLHHRLRDKEQQLSKEELLNWKNQVSGYLVPGTRAKLIDSEDGSEVPWDGESEGEFAFRSPWGTASYWEMPEKTAEKTTDDGYLRMGDLVRMNEYADIEYRDRLKHTVKSGGEWIPSPIVEEHVAEHPDVAECVVIAAEHEEWMERPLAIVTLVEGADELDIDDLEAEMMQFVEEGAIQEWWIPDEVVVVDSIPRTPTEKYDKSALHEKYGDIFISDGTKA
jgi:fatty-acyl-CoA synthase